MESRNPYSTLMERIKKHVPDCKLIQGMGLEEAYDEINRCFDIIDNIINNKVKDDNLMIENNK